MTAKDDLERRIADFCAAETPPRAPAWLLESALATIDTTQQRRVLIRVPWRFQNMNSFAKVAIAAVAVIAIAGIGLAVLRPGTGPGPGPGGQGSPSPSPSIGPSASPAAQSLPALTETFTSAINGISISYPAGWTPVLANKPWTSSLPPACDPPCADRIYKSDSDSPFIGISSQPLAGQTGEQWAAAVISEPMWGDTCAPETEPISVDGASGLIAIHCPERTLTALIWTADRGYLIVLYRIDDSASLDRLLATVQLSPEDALDAAPSASPAGP